MKKLLFLLSVACSTLLLYAQTNQVVWLNGKLLYEQPIASIDSITYNMNNMITGDTLKLILPRATQQNLPSTTTSKVKQLHAQTNQAVWLNGKLLYWHPITTIDSITYDMSNMITGDTLNLIMPRATKDIVYQTITQEVHDTITHIVHDTITHIVRDTVTNVICDTIRIYNTSTTDARSGVLAGAFSVSSNKQVAFTKGNLQYTQSTSTWSFAESQYKVLGIANVSGSALADKIDLFGWSSTGTVEWGISTSTSVSDYEVNFVDWGKNYIFLYNGTNILAFNCPDTYRTLTIDEWNYLLNGRIDSDNKNGVARIILDILGRKYVNGLILLPDDWTCPAGITFKSGFASTIGDQAYADYQTFTISEWQRLEAAGAVFLPASGYRNGASVNNVQSFGYYWSATTGSNFANYLYITPNGSPMGRGYNLYYGYAVRLVKDL